MAAQFNRADVFPPKRSSLEEDDGSHFYPGATSDPSFAKHHHLVGRGGMDVCDSGVSLTSIGGCDVLPSLGVSDQFKPQLGDQQTCVSVGYSSFGGPGDTVVDSALEGQMDELSITCSSTEAVTKTTPSMETTASPATEPVDPRREFIDRLKICFTPDADGDT